MTERSFAALEKSVDDVAAYWFVRLSDPDCTPAERHAFEAWKAQDAFHEIVFLEIQRGNALLDKHMDDPDIEALLNEAREASRSKRWTRYWPAALGTAVAASLVMVALVHNPIGTSSIDESVVSAASVEIGPQIFETDIGEQSRFALDDGSIVTLNTNSRIEVSYTGDARNILLTRGQGYFEVERDVTRPFSVEAGDRRVVALGTAFDVFLDEMNGVEVTLIEGEVEVDILEPVEAVNAPSGVSPRRAVKSETSSVRLKPGDQLVAMAMADPLPEIREVRTTTEVAWTRGLLVYQAEPIESAIAEINRYSHQRLVLADDERLRALTIDGVFKSGSLSAIIAGLENAYPVEVQRTGADELTVLWQK